MAELGPLTIDGTAAGNTEHALEHDFRAYVVAEENGVFALSLLIENLHCPSCIRQIEGVFADEPDIVEARVNLTTRRLRLRWRGGARRAADLAAKVAALDFVVVPYAEQAAGNAGEQERKKLLRCVAVAGFAASNVMLLSVAIWAGEGSMNASTRTLLHWFSALIALPAIVYAARPFWVSAFAAIRSRSINMDVPISLAMILAASMSLFETARGGEHAYFDAAIMLLFILLIGRFLDHLARARARSAAERLSILGATVAHVVGPDGLISPVAAAAVTPGATIVVRPGERVPVDGIVIGGASDLDVSLISGETLPKAVQSGDSVLAGTLNLTGSLRLKAQRAGENTVLAGIVRLMEAAEEGRARYLRLADRAARLYAPVVHLAALLAFAGWVLLGGMAWQPALVIAISVLIITCPCALGLAVPVVQVVACGRLFERGVLVKQGDALERLAEVDIVILDKTGTVTLGRPELIRSKDTTPAIGRLAAGMAAGSHHPLCRALVSAFGPAEALADVRETPGLGLSTQRDGAEIRLGSRTWCGIAEPDGTAPNDIGPEIWLVGHGGPPVRFAFRDMLRPDAVETVAALGAMGLVVELLSGDRPSAVSATAESLGITRWQAGCTPVDKTDRIAALAADGHRVLMVGDGLNDAPSLSTAHVSASPSAAVDISRTAADIVIQGAALAPLVEAITVARKARRLAFQNLGMAAGYNALAVPLAVAGFVTPLIAALAMSGSSIVVTLNALRLRERLWPRKGDAS